MADVEAPIVGGTVSSIEGTASVRGPDGQVRRLEEGDTVRAGDVIITDSSSSVEIDCNAETPFAVPADTEFLASEECFSFEGDASENEVADETIAAVAEALESGGDLLDVLDATAAGGTTGNNGHTFIRLGRIVLALSDGSNVTEEELLAVLEDVLGQGDLLEQSAALVSIIGEYTITEGDTSGAFVLLLNQAPESVGSDITVTLNYSGVAQDGTDFNGVASVVIPAGSNATAFTIDTIDDALAEGAETFTISIGAISDTNFVTIDADPDANSVTNTIVDEPTAGPEDTALVSIAGEYTITEGETSGEFTVAVDQPAGDVTSDITVALVYSGVAEDGTDFTGVAEVTIAAGTNSATFSIDTIDDALAEGSESLVISLGDITDTNFEAIAADPAASSVTNAIVDETDPDAPNPPDTAYELRLFAVIETTNELEGQVFTSTEYVDALSITEDGGVGTYVVLAVDENGDPLAEADQPGGTVTVTVGAVGDTADRAVDYDSTATVVATVGTTFTIAAVDDVYADNNEVFSLGLSEDWSRAGEFEGVAYSGTVTTTILDETNNDPDVPEDNDSVTVSLGDLAVDEGSGDVTIMGSLDAVPDEEFVVTLDNGATITFGTDYVVGTEVESTPFSIQSDDVYVDAETLVLSIASFTADVFESVNVDDTSQVVISDTTDDTTLTLNDVAVSESDGGTATITASLDNAPQTELVVTLSNGATITFAAGATSATSTAFAINNDEDVYVDGSSFELSVSSTSGGNFENLVTTDTSTVTVSDTTDDTTLTLNDVTVSESDGGTATITASLDNAPQTELVVTLSNGATITFAAGATSATSTAFAINNDEDVYVDGSSFELSVSSTSGGNFENLVTTDTSTVTVSDTTDDTTLTLNDVTVSESDGGTATITASLDNAPQTELVVTLSNGATITFAAGATSATSTAFAINNDEDVYVDGSSFELSVSSTSGGNFENLVTTDTSTVTVSDTTDDTTLTLNDVAVSESDGGTATITASLDNAPQTELVVTLSNGATITFAAGATSATSTAFAINNDEDVYVDGSSFELSVSSTSGGNFENLVTTDTSTVTVSDTTDDTTLTLNDVAVSESDGGTATITASLDNAPQTELVVTLSNGATITFAAGATSATSTAFAINNDEDVYVDGSSFELSVSSTSGGNFENLVTTDTSTVTVSDTTDDTTLTLNDVAVSESDGGTATITASLDNAPQTELVVTLSNGATITFAAGATSATSTAFAINNDEDVYVDGSSFELSVSSTSGGNFENLVTTDTSTVTVSDTTDDTTLTLNDVAVSESDGGTATITASLDNAPQTELVVTLSNGATITFAAGATSATSTAFAINNDEDVYVDGSSFELSVSSTSGGNFENLVTTDTSTVTVSDTIDTVTVDLSATETVAEDGTITYTATLTGGVANNDITVTLANGEVITIAAGDASGTVDVAAPTDDAYVTAAITNSIASAVEANAGTAGALENLAVAGDTSVSTDVTENDTETTISLVDLAVDEGSGTASVTATIANAPTDGPVVVTLDNGATITFAVGATSATSTAFAIQGDDVYLDGETLTLNASVTSGGSEFENLTLDPTVDVVVSDTIDTVTVDLSATETVAEDGTITYTATLTGGVANNDITVTLANGEVITIAAGDASGTVDVAAPTDDAYVTAAITNSIASAVEANAGTAGALENLAVAGDTSVSTDVTENDTETTISLVDLAVDEGSGTASVTATIANAPTDGPVVVTLDNGATITFAVGATSATSTAFAIQGDDVYLDGETLTLNASVTSGGSEFENLTLDPTVDVVVSDTIDTVTVDLSATETVAEDGTITYTATLTGGVANNDITVTLANGEVITIAAGDASGTVDVAAPTDDAYVTAAITNSIASAVEANAGTAGALENLAVAGDTSVSTDVTENDTETTISLVDLAVDEGSGTASVTATIANAPTDGPVVVTLDNGATITFAVGATSATSTAFAIQGDDVYLDGETLTLNASVTSGGSEFENLTLDPTVDVVVSDTIDTVTVDLSATETVAEDGTITYTATLTGGVANNDITVTLANGEVITIAAGDASGTVDVAAPTDDAYVTAAITNSIASAVEANAGTAGALENLAVAGDTSVSTDVTENDTETTISLVDLAVDEGSGTASVTATIANAPTDGPVVVTLDNGATITFAVGATSATSTAFAIQGDDVYLDGETLTLNASVTSGGSEFENLTLDPTVDVVVSDTIDTVTVDLSATETVAEDGTITYTATLTGGVANNDITVTLANGEVITIAAGDASGTVDVAAPTDDAYVTAAITNSIASAVEANAGTAGALENLAVAGDTSVSTDVTENDTETTISLVDLAVDEGSGTASVTATIANAPTDGPVVVTLDNGATITFAVGATSATSTAFAIQGDDVYLDGETLTLNASVTSGGSEFENLTLDPTVDVVVSDTIDTVTVDLSATETVAEDGTITYTATLTGGVANNDITVTLANGEVITIAAGDASGTVDVAAPTDDAYVTAAITNSIASAVEANAGTAGALENLAVAGDTSVSTDVTENDTETTISLVDLAVDEGSGTASVTATIANAPTDGPVVVTLDNGATITFAVGATSATSTAFAIQGDDVYLDGETLTLNASVTSGGSEFENLTLDPTVDVVVSDTIDTVTVDLSATETVAEDGTITYTATLTGGVANNDITVTLANGEVITIAAGDASGTVDVAAPTDDAYVTAAITNSIASAVEANAGTAGALENLAVAGDTSVSTDVTENDTETTISLVDLAVDEGSGTASVTATIANAPTDGPVVVTLDNGATITFAVGATSATSTAFAIQGDDVYLDGETLTLNASVTSGGSEFENLTLDPTVDVVVSDTIDTVTVDLSATETVAEDGTITYTATLTGGVANNDITVTLANGEVITIAAGDASGTVDVAAPTDDAYVTAAITNSIASAVEANAGTAGALENLAVAGDTSVSTDVTENDTETTISLVDLAVDEGSGTASVTATIANAPTDGPVVVTLDNGATITFAVGATSATSTAFAIQGDDVYLDGETLTLNASVTSGGSEFENLTLDPTVDVVVSDTIDTVTVDLSATETVAEDGTITYTATLTGGVANNDITVTLANGEVITIAAGDASGTVDVAAPTDDAYVTAAITNSIASAVEANAGTAGALENLAVAGDTSVSTDVTENDTETTISLVDLAVDEGSGTASVTATIANAPTDGPVVVTLDNGATITFAVGATSATSTAFAIQGDDVYLDGETLTLNASVTSGGSEFENLTLDPTVDVVVSDTIDTVTVDLSATETVAEDGTITYTATLTGGVANNDITVTLANGEVITIAAGDASGTVDVAAPTDDAYVTAAITNSIASAVEANAGTAGALENLAVAGDTSVSTDVTENDTETTISLVDLAVDEGSGTASVTATIANAPTDGPVVVTLDNGATITFAVGATSATSTAFAIQGDDVYLDGETLTLNASVTSGGSEFENLTLDPTVDVVVSDTIDTTVVTLSSNDAVEGTDITITASVASAPQNTDLVITLDSGDEITIAVGQTTGSVTFVNTGSAGDTITYAIASASGGNYEALNTEDTAVVSITEPLSAVADDVSVAEDTLVDGISGNESSAAQITVSGGAGDIVSAVIDSSTSTNGEWAVSDTGLVTYTLTSAYGHADGNGANVAENVDSVTITVTDSDGNTAEVTLNADITDDVPEFLSVADADNDDIVELFAPNVADTYSEQFADWDFGADGSGIAIPSLSSITGNVSVVSASATQIVAELLDDNGDVAAILTLNGNGDDSLEVIEREPETVTVELLTSLAQAGGPVGSVEIVAPEITVVVTGDNGDATLNDPGNDTVNTSTNGWGVKNQNLNPDESLTFDFGMTSALDFQFDTTKFTGGGATRNLEIEVTYSDGTTDVLSISTIQGETVHLSQLTGFDATKGISSVTVLNNGPGSLNLNNITVDVESIEPVADLNFQFTLGTGAIEDSDGDIASRIFSIELSGSSAGSFSSGGAAPIAVDLDGDGVEYLSRNAGVTFTDQESGADVETAWVAPDDGLLVIDANNSGTVDSSSEYVFTEWSDNAQTDLEAIAEVFDTNQDGVLDAQDERFDEFAVWQDHDSDGVTDEGELTSLTDLGIESIELTYREDSDSRVDGDGDVTVFGQVNVNYEDGSTTTAEDVSFAVEAADLLSEEDDLTDLLSEESVGERGEDIGPSRADAAAIDVAQLELTLNLEHQESDSFDQHD